MNIKYNDIWNYEKGSKVIIHSGVNIDHPEFFIHYKFYCQIKNIL